MIDADHLPHPETMPEYLIENNAMLNKVLHNQACILDMLWDIYEYSYMQEFKKKPPATPSHPEVLKRAARCDGRFDLFKTVVSQIYKRIIVKLYKRAHVSQAS